MSTTLTALVAQLHASLDILRAELDTYFRRAAPASAITVAFINEATTISDLVVMQIMKALQIQVVRDFYPYWGTYARLLFVPKGQAPPKNAWQLVFLDDADVANALGYHDVTATGLPLGKVFVRTTIGFGGEVSVTASHELLEMLADPEINLTVFVQDSNTTGLLYAYEVCDACEVDSDGYDIEGVRVSDFVFPSWFGGETGPFDFKEKIKKPLQLLPGGYISIYDVTRGSGWQQLNASGDHKTAFKDRPQVGSRRERRRIGREQWTRSTTVVEGTV